jgi:threonine dehydratase
VGIELKDPKDFEPLVARMKAEKFYSQYLNDKPDLFQFLI